MRNQFAYESKTMPIIQFTPVILKQERNKLYSGMVRISPERIKELQKLLKEQAGKDYSDEEAQEAGLAIMRFVIAKEQRRQELSNNHTFTAEIS